MEVEQENSSENDDDDEEERVDCREVLATAGGFSPSSSPPLALPPPCIPYSAVTDY